MKLINESDIDYLLVPIAPLLKGEMVHYEQVAFRKQIEAIPPITEKEGVRIIWEHQIDDLIKQIKAKSLGKWYTGRIDGKTEEVALLKDVIEILEEAKK